MRWMTSNRLYSPTDLSKGLTQRNVFISELTSILLVSGFVILQPGGDEAGLAAMQQEVESGQCEFDLSKKSPPLNSCDFGTENIAGHQKHGHGNICEGFALRFVINKSRYLCSCCEFTDIIDYWCLKWIMP